MAAIISSSLSLVFSTIFSSTLGFGIIILALKNCNNPEPNNNTKGKIKSASIPCEKILAGDSARLLPKKFKSKLKSSPILKGEINTKLQVADLVLDPATHEVYRGGKEIKLSSKEYRLLDYMMRRPGNVCTRTMIGEHIWGYNFTDDSNVIDVYISYLRRKIDYGFKDKLIHTVRDVGYKIQDKSIKPLKLNNEKK